MRAWMILEQVDTGEREPDGQGGWIPKVITKPLACTEDSECVKIINDAINALREHQAKHDPNQTKTIVRANVQVLKHTAEEVIDSAGEKSLLDEILEQD